MIRHADAGDRVVVALLTSGELGLRHLAREEAWRAREAESCAAAAVLGTAATHFLRLPDWGLVSSIALGVAALGQIIRAERPGMIYLPHPEDDHPDHRACLPIVRGALADGLFAGQLRGYEVWTPMSGWDVAIDISPVMERKLAAVRAFASQLTEFRYDLAVQGLAQYRGAMAARCASAEVFRLLSAR